MYQLSQWYNWFMQIATGDAGRPPPAGPADRRIAARSYRRCRPWHIVISFEVENTAGKFSMMWQELFEELSTGQSKAFRAVAHIRDEMALKFPGAGR